MLHLILGLTLASQQPSETQEATFATAELEKALNEDAAGASVITVLSSGDLVIFDSAITVPAQRPSVEECGVLMSMAPRDRRAELAAARKKAEDETFARRMSQRERLAYLKGALESERSCQALFKRKCEEINKRVLLEVRKKAVADAKTSIDKLLAEDKIKKRIRSYLENVLAECPLER